MKNRPASARGTLEDHRRWIGRARRCSNLTGIQSVGGNDLENYGVATDLAVDRSGREARIAVKVQCAGNGRVAGSDVLALG